MKRLQFRLRRLIKVSDLDRAIMRQMHEQSCVLERHEHKIAKHTAIQSRIAAWQLIIGLITTAALIYISYQQYVASERQVSLEYAKISPRFEIKYAPFERTNSVRYEPFPKDLTIRILRGEAVITNVQIYHDMTMAIIDSNEIHHRCNIRVSNYFISKSSLTDWRSSDIFQSISSKPSGFYPTWPGKFFYTVQNGPTWVLVHFRDIFGENRVELFGGSESDLQKLPSSEIPKDEIEKVYAARLKASEKINFPFLFEKSDRIDDGECEYIINKLQ